MQGAGGVKRSESREELTSTPQNCNIEVEVTSPHPTARGASAIILVASVIQNPGLRVALKVYPVPLTPTGKELLRRELTAARDLTLQHERILPFIGTCAYGLNTILVSPYCERGNFLDCVRREEKLDIHHLILQVAQAVEFLHTRANRVHGDLKCENVLVSVDGDAMLADFGLSTSIEKLETEGITQTSIAMRNTLRFAAPELLASEIPQQGPPRSKTPATDVYAFGMLVLQAFSGASPWESVPVDMGVIVRVFLGETPSRPSKATANGLTDLHWSVCQQCWAYDPEDRPPITRVRAILSGDLLDQDLANSSNREKQSDPQSAGGPVIASTLTHQRLKPPSGTTKHWARTSGTPGGGRVVGRRDSAPRGPPGAISQGKYLTCAQKQSDGAVEIGLGNVEEAQALPGTALAHDRNRSVASAEVHTNHRLPGAQPELDLQPAALKESHDKLEENKGQPAQTGGRFGGWNFFRFGRQTAGPSGSTGDEMATAASISVDNSAPGSVAKPTDSEAAMLVNPAHGTKARDEMMALHPGGSRPQAPGTTRHGASAPILPTGSTSKKKAQSQTKATTPNRAPLHVASAPQIVTVPPPQGKDNPKQLQPENATVSRGRALDRLAGDPDFPAIVGRFKLEQRGTSRGVSTPPPTRLRMLQDQLEAAVSATDILHGSETEAGVLFSSSTSNVNAARLTTGTGSHYTPAGVDAGGGAEFGIVHHIQDLLHRYS